MNGRLVLAGAVSIAAVAAGEDSDPLRVAQASGRTVESEYVEPFQVFDNLYYVGIDWVSAWVIDTGEGLVLLDTLYGEFTELLFDNIRKVGLDPGDVKYALCTHGHFDHAAGATAVKERTGARIGMTGADWAMFHEAAGPRWGYDDIPTDLVLRDGDTITLGKTTIRIYETPGHTPGVASMAFTVHDGDVAYEAFMFGGVGLNFSGVDRCRMYVRSVERIQGMDGIDVNITNHASMGGIFERAEKLRGRKAGEAHPFVAPDEFSSWLAGLMANIQRKLRREVAR